MFRRNAAECSTVCASVRVVAAEFKSPVLIDRGDTLEHGYALFIRMLYKNHVVDPRIRDASDQNNITVIKRRRHRIAADPNGFAKPHQKQQSVK